MIYKYKINYKSIGGSSSTSSPSTSSSSTKNVLFACTTLDEDSTLSENFKEINKLVRSDLKDEDKLQAYFVYKYSYGKYDLIEQGEKNEIMSTDLKPELENNGYIINNPQDVNLVNFLRENDLKFDKIILTQCNEIVTLITGDEIEPTFSIIFENLKQIYSSLKNDGVIINYYYGINGELSLSSFSNTFAGITLDYFPYVLFILILISNFFEKKDIGIYHKKLNVNVDSINIEEIINNLTIHFNKTDNYTTVEEYKKFLIDSLFTFSTNENDFFIIEDLFQKTFFNIIKYYIKEWKNILSPNEQPSSFKI
jgi:hypothetical protein|tara:strand:+ start:348 stop:1277 length:930 start_codon:yes stop_codon:yes gene_type:complete